MTVQVVCDSVEHWAASYDGPPFHAILTDPPYELQFMGKHWDGSGVSFQPETWAALAAHLLPGAHVLSFGGDRTHHRLMCAIEDAGLELRGCLYWAFGQGFPKSANVSKHLDRMAKSDRQVIGTQDVGPDMRGDNYQRANGRMIANITAPATPAAATWEGYGSALKPAVEVICMARKPLDGTIAANCERYGSGALNIDGTRISTTPRTTHKDGNHQGTHPGPMDWGKETGYSTNGAAGRWPANLVLSHLPGCKRVGTKRVKHGGGTGEASIHNDGAIFGNEIHERFWYADPDGLETVDAWECAPGCPTQLFPETTSGGFHNTIAQPGERIYGLGLDSKARVKQDRDADSGSAARFFFQASWEFDQAEQLAAADVLRYCAKASRAERNQGLDGMEQRAGAPYTNRGGLSHGGNLPQQTPHKDTPRANHHPTVKPLSLCRYLATLLLPPAAYAPRRILVPFGGVASEAIGAMLAGWDEIVMVEKEREYCDIGEARVVYWQGKMDKQIALPLEVLA